MERMENESGIQLPELTTTLDPSYVIRLIRTFLTPEPVGTIANLPETFTGQENGHVDTAQANTNNDIETAASSDMDATEETGAVRVSESRQDEIVQASSLTDSGSRFHEDHSIAAASRRESQSGDGGEREHHVAMRTDSQEGATDQSTAEHQEEAGCVLWDLASDSGHAQFLVQQQICAVVLAVLSVPHSDRINEIALGILANLACHKETAGQVTDWPGLRAKVGEILQANDPPTLTELCRLLSAGLHSGGGGAAAWVEGLQSDEVLERLLWIGENTNHPPLQEKSLEVLLAPVSSPTLLKLLNLGLPARLTRMLGAELEQDQEEKGGVALDLLLQIGEALSLDATACAQLAQDSALFCMVGKVVRSAVREDMGSAVGSGIILMANLVSGDRALVDSLVADPELLRAFLRALPFLDDDSGAQAAFWSILTQALARLLGGCENAPAEALAVLVEGAGDLIQTVEESGQEEESEVEAMQQSAVANLRQLLASSNFQHAQAG